MTRRTAIISAIAAMCSPIWTRAGNLAVSDERKVFRYRPDVLGVRGVTYFVANEPCLEYRLTSRYPGMKLFFNGLCIHNYAFECDLIGQWVGIYRLRADPDTLKIIVVPTQKYWVKGRVRIETPTPTVF